MHARDAGDRAAEAEQSPAATELVLPLYVEDIAISRRTVATAVVRVATVTQRRDHRVDERLTRERVEIEHVPVGRYVDSIPPVRQEGAVTIMPIVEEVLVVEKKLLLREEVHIRRVQSTQQHVETVQLREQTAVITRMPANSSGGYVSTATLLNSNVEPMT